MVGTTRAASTVALVRVSGIWFALIAAFLFGVSGVVAADVFSEVDPTRVAQLRSLMAAVFLLAIATRRRALRVRGHITGLLLFGVLLAAVTITYYWAIDRLGVGPGVTLQFLGPALVLVWMRLVQRRPVPGPAWLAAGLAVVGTALMARVWEAGDLDAAGVAAGLAAAVTFAGYLIVGEQLGRELPGITVVGYGFGISAIIWLAASPPLDLPGGALWGKLIWIGIAGTALPFLAEIAALKRGDPGQVGVVATAEPVVAAITAWVAIGQRLSSAQVVGGLFTVLGVAVIQRVTHSVAPDVPPAAV